MKRMKKKLLSWSISSGLLISTALYSSLSLAYRVDRGSNSIQSTLKVPHESSNIYDIRISKEDIESVESYRNKASKTKKEKVIESTEDDQTGIYLSNNGKVSFDKIKIIKKGKSSSIYKSGVIGLNSAVINEGDILLDRSLIRTYDDTSKGYYQSGESSKGKIIGSIFETYNNDSNGVEVSDQGSLKINHVAIHTQGLRSAGLSSSAEGSLEANNTIVFTTGEGAPGFYNGGRLSLLNTDISSNNSYVGIIEGENSLISINSKLKGKKGIKLINHSDNDELSDEGFAVIGFKNGFIDIQEDPVFNIDNISAIINLNNTDIKGKNKVIINAESNIPREIKVNLFNQRLAGDINNEGKSEVNVNLYNNSIYNGSILNGASINIDNTSKWQVKGNSFVGKISVPNDNVNGLEKYIITNGKNISYDVNKNKWLSGKVIYFADGGSLSPK